VHRPTGPARLAAIRRGARRDRWKTTDADLNALLHATAFNDEQVFQSVIAAGRWDDGRRTEVRPHRIDLRYGERLARSGLPRPARDSARSATRHTSGLSSSRVVADEDCLTPFTYGRCASIPCRDPSSASPSDSSSAAADRMDHHEN